MPSITPMPGMASPIRGVVPARGQLLPLVGARALFGLPSRQAAKGMLVTTLRTHRTAHEQWLKALEDSARDGSPFTLETHPHRCGFGRWYDSFHADHFLLVSHMKKFDAPHKRIHGLAQTVLQLATSGQQHAALHHINTARNTLLAELIQLFEDAESLINDLFSEIALLLSAEGHSFALSVDSVDTLEEWDSSEIQAVEELGGQALSGVTAIAHRPQPSVPALVLDPRMIAEFAGLTALQGSLVTA